MKTFSPLLTLVFACALLAFSRADEGKSPASPQPSQKEQPSQEVLFKNFKKTLSQATLSGHFTVLGQDDPNPRREEYTISSVQKLEEGDYWLFKARIKYGDTDRTVPMPLEVKWAGTTPVITLDNVTIPGMGTFDARVVIHDNQYVGTWRHGDKGGQLFGVIKRSAEGTPADEKPATGNN